MADKNDSHLGSARHERIDFAEAGFALINEHAGHDIGVVFVHGWGGDAELTWTWPPASFLDRLAFWRNEAPVSLFGLLVGTPELRCDYYSFAHSAGPASLTGITTVSDALGDFVDSRVVSHNAHVLFVAHSLGGLACRRTILKWLDLRDTLAQRVVGLIMFATPNDGTELARLVGLSPSATQMKPFSDFLATLNSDWVRRIVNGGNPKEDPSGRLILNCQAVIGTKDKIVSPASASALSHLGDVRTIDGQGHSEICKARNERNVSMRMRRAWS